MTWDDRGLFPCSGYMVHRSPQVTWVSATLWDPRLTEQLWWRAYKLLQQRKLCLHLESFLPELTCYLLLTFPEHSKWQGQARLHEGVWKRFYHVPWGVACHREDFGHRDPVSARPLTINLHFHSEVTLSQRPAVFSWPEVRCVDKASVLFLAYEARDGVSSKASSFAFSAKGYFIRI